MSFCEGDTQVAHFCSMCGPHFCSVSRRGDREQGKATAGAYPYGEGKHTLQLLEHALAMLTPCVEQHFGVAVRAERVPARSEAAAQVREVVDLSVENAGHLRRACSSAAGFP